MRWFLHKQVNLDMNDGRKINALTLEVDGTGITVQNAEGTFYYQWTQVQNLYI